MRKNIFLPKQRNNNFCRNNEKAAALHYDTYGKLYHNARNEEFYGYLAGKMLQAIGHRPFKSILEIGCGTGILTGKLIERFPDSAIDAIDVSKNMLKIASSRFAETVNFFRDLSEPPDQAYDLIISNYSYHWWSKDFCKRLKDYISKDSLFALSAPAKCNDLASGNIAIARAIRNLNGSKKRYSKAAGITGGDIKSDLNLTGLQILNEVFCEEFNNSEELLRTLRIRGSLLALSSTYGIDENVLEHEIQTVLTHTQTPIRITWPALIITSKKHKPKVYPPKSE